MKQTIEVAESLFLHTVVRESMILRGHRRAEEVPQVGPKAHFERPRPTLTAFLRIKNDVPKKTANR